MICLQDGRAWHASQILPTSFKDFYCQKRKSPLCSYASVKSICDAEISIFILSKTELILKSLSITALESNEFSEGCRTNSERLCDPQNKKVTKSKRTLKSSERIYHYSL